MKNEIRKEILTLRKAIPESIIEENSKKITQKVLDHPVYQRSELVLCYIDAKNEVKTRDIIEDAWKAGKTVAVPKVHGDIMEFYIIKSYEQLEEGSFGILEPDRTCELLTEIADESVVVMPGVAFDVKGNRIGYGKGYYDKYFSKWPKVYKIAIAFSLQIVSDIPADELDVQADCVITEQI